MCNCTLNHGFMIKKARITYQLARYDKQKYINKSCICCNTNQLSQYENIINDQQSCICCIPHQIPVNLSSDNHNIKKKTKKISKINGDKFCCTSHQIPDNLSSDNHNIKKKNKKIIKN